MGAGVGPPVVRRDSGRVVVIDPDGLVLLVRVVEPSSPAPAIWITPGGGIDGDESPAETAARELAEETGCDVGPAGLVGPIAVTRGEWTFRGQRLFSEDWFFVLEHDRFSPQPRLLTEIEAEVHAGWRWWSLADLDAPDEPVLPGGLAELVRRLQRWGWEPGAPAIELPWVVAVDRSTASSTD